MTNIIETHRTLTARPTGQIIVDALVAEGVQRVYGMPGGHILGIYDAIAETEGIDSILVRHEHTAAAMAAGEAQLTGIPGVVLVTAGPGATNTLTAVAEAYVGALPLVVFAGRGPTQTVYRGASQELPTELAFRPMVKWSTRVDRADLLQAAVHRAFREARTGKPGPVLIDIPRDLLLEQVAPEIYRPVGALARLAADSDAVAAAAAKLASAERPLLVAGGGALASRASDALVALAERLEAPVLTSLAGRGAIPESHRLAAGGLGAHRNPVSRRLLQEADVVVGVGTRFEEMETNWQSGALPSADAVYIQIDIDPVELGRSVPTDHPLTGDARTVLEQLRSSIGDGVPSATVKARAAEVERDIADLDRRIDELALSDGTPLNPVRVIRAARRVFPADTVLAVDVGALAQHIGGAFPYFRVNEPRSTLVPSSFYGMGFVSSALPVAPLVHPGRPALCFVGDGSFQMTMFTLPVAADYGLGVTWCVLNDEALGSIRDIQVHLFGERIVDTEFRFQPDFAGIARACGAHGETVREPDELDAALERCLEANRSGIPAVLDARVAPIRLTQTREHYFQVFGNDDTSSDL